MPDIPYSLPKVKHYVEALMTPLIKALHVKVDSEMKAMQTKIEELESRIETLEGP